MHFLVQTGSHVAKDSLPTPCVARDDLELPMFLLRCSCFDLLPWTVLNAAGRHSQYWGLITE